MMPEEPLKKVAEEVGSIAKEGVQMVATTIKLAKDVWQAAKIEAVKRGITLAAMIEEALRRYLKELEESK
ncbi:MAG: CopG family transcriptional regulator [Candidatus Hadarchaeales archaeon]